MPARDTHRDLTQLLFLTNRVHPKRAHTIAALCEQVDTQKAAVCYSLDPKGDKRLLSTQIDPTFFAALFFSGRAAELRYGGDLLTLEAFHFPIVRPSLVALGLTESYLRELRAGDAGRHGDGTAEQDAVLALWLHANQDALTAHDGFTARASDANRDGASRVRLIPEALTLGHALFAEIDAIDYRGNRPGHQLKVAHRERWARAFVSVADRLGMSADTVVPLIRNYSAKKDRSAAVLKLSRSLGAPRKGLASKPNLARAVLLTKAAHTYLACYLTARLQGMGRPFPGTP